MAINALKRKDSSKQILEAHLERKQEKLSFKQAATALTAIASMKSPLSPTRKANINKMMQITVREPKKYKLNRPNILMDYQKLQFKPLANYFEGSQSNYNNYFSTFKQMWLDKEHQKAIAHLNREVIQKWRDIPSPVVQYACRLSAFFHEGKLEVKQAQSYIEFAWKKAKDPEDYIRLAYYACYFRDYRKAYDICEDEVLSEHPMSYYLIAEMVVAGNVALPMIEEDEYEFYHAKDKIFYRYAIHYYQLALALATLHESTSPLPALAIAKLYIIGCVPSSYNEVSTSTPDQELTTSNLTQAVPYLQMASEAKSAEATFILGYFYWKGKGGLSCDVKASRAHLKQAVRISEYIPAVFMLALNYHHGWDDTGYGRSHRRALYYYHLGARKGHVGCMTNYGYCLMQQGDIMNGYRYFQKAASAGDARAQYNLARILRTGIQSKNGHLLIHPQPQTALVYLRKAALAKNPSAQHDLAIYLSRDGPIEHNMESKMLLRLAASQRRAPHSTRSLFSKIREKEHMHTEELINYLNHPDSFHKWSPLPIGTLTDSSYYNNVSQIEPRLDPELRPYLPSSPDSLFRLPTPPSPTPSSSSPPSSPLFPNPERG